MNALKNTVVLAAMMLAGTHLTNAQTKAGHAPAAKNVKQAEVKEDKFFANSDGQTIDITPFVKQLGLSKAQLDHMNYKVWAGGTNPKDPVEISLEYDDNKGENKFKASTTIERIKGGRSMIGQSLDVEQNGKPVISMAVDLDLGDENKTLVQNFGKVSKGTPSDLNLPLNQFKQAAGIKSDVTFTGAVAEMNAKNKASVSATPAPPSSAAPAKPQ